MTRILLIVPTRDRPQSASRLIELLNSDRSPNTTLVFGVDLNDPQRDAYQALTERWLPPNVIIRFGTPAKLAEWTNRLALELIPKLKPDIVGSIGDDHVLTPGWEAKVINAFRRNPIGFVYGDDGLQGVNLPTACFVSSVIVSELGWFMLPTLEHMFVDNVWRDLGLMTGTLRYLPDLKIPHLHWINGKADKDDSYVRSNGHYQYMRDEAAYVKWKATGQNLTDAYSVRKVKELYEEYTDRTTEALSD